MKMITYIETEEYGWVGSDGWAEGLDGPRSFVRPCERCGHYVFVFNDLLKVTPLATCKCGDNSPFSPACCERHPATAGASYR